MKTIYRLKETNGTKDIENQKETEGPEDSHNPPCTDSQLLIISLIYLPIIIKYIFTDIVKYHHCTDHLNIQYEERICHIYRYGYLPMVCVFIITFVTLYCYLIYRIIVGKK